MVEHKQVRTFVGLDAHADHCNLKGLSRQGKDVLEVEVPTAVAELRAAVKDVRRPVWVMLEATAVAPLVKWALEPVVDRVIVCETRENRWIAKSEDASDTRDADRLARLLRMGEYKEVHVPKQERQELRNLVRLCDKTVRDGTRLKNRIKAKYREQGVSVKGYAVYDAEGREACLKQIGRPMVRFLLEVLYGELDAVEVAQEKLERKLSGMLRHRREYKQVVTIPGYGPTNGAIFVAVVDDPHRFETSRKLWKYSGLSVREPWSGRKENAKPGGSFVGNRLLKYAAMVAAKRSLQGDNQFSRHHALMLERGLDPAMADKTIARRLLATALAIWKSGKDYQEPARTP
jgi:transposase